MEKQIQIQYKLLDIKQLQFVNIADQWPDGDLQIGQQLQFNCDTEKRVLVCKTHFEYKKNDITQLIFSMQTSIEFAREGWSAMYQLQGDQWVIPAGLLQHLAGLTIDAARGMLALRSEEAGLPKLILPLVNPAQILKNNISFRRNPGQTAMPFNAVNGNA